MLKRCVIVGGADIGNYGFLRETLLPDDYIILCDTSTVSVMRSYRARRQ